MIEKVKMSVGKWDKLEIKQDTSSWPGCNMGHRF